MLFHLFLLRLGPMAGLWFFKDRKKIKNIFLGIIITYVVLLCAAVRKIFGQEQWKVIFYLPVSLFPHYLCYGFAVWLIIRCVWSSWSDRVWKRIYGIALASIIFGVFAENYWNPKILQFFCNFFK